MARNGSRIPGLKPDLPVTAAAARTLEVRLAPLASLVARAGRGRSPNADAIHNLRVGCRRAAAALLVYRELLPGPACDWWQKRLRKLRRAAGSIRTLDVLIRRMEEHHPTSPLIETWAGERKERLDPFRKQLGKLPTDERLEARQQELLTGVVWKGEGDEPTFAAWAAGPLATAVDEFLAAEPEDHGCFTALHDFRVAGKRLRYTLELLGAAIGDEAAAATPVVEEFQSRLGGIQDRYDACRRLGAALDELHMLDDVRTITGVLHAESSAVEHDIESFWRFWKTAKPQLRKLRRKR
jgi:CHAD domain-containing protein